ncbi:hypothetical protein R3P38DRAFT_2857414 [Favolaschia claudopus]|uniref:Secreted protein n=1 Tax=Favolaschia claudopus TaxID=2862362 RepID=A0AAW0DFY3_9AGAR
MIRVHYSMVICVVPLVVITLLLSAPNNPQRDGLYAVELPARKGVGRFDCTEPERRLVVGGVEFRGTCAFDCAEGVDVG